MASKQCKTSSDCFSYVCGYYISGQHSSYEIVKGTKFWTVYRLYFGMNIGDQDKYWAPHVICGSYRSNLEGWLMGSGRFMLFAVPRVWREPQNSYDDRYFCIINISKYHYVRGKRAMTKPSIRSTIAPVPHSDALPVPSPPSNVSHFLWVM